MEETPQERVFRNPYLLSKIMQYVCVEGNQHSCYREPNSGPFFIIRQLSAASYFRHPYVVEQTFQSLSYNRWESRIVYSILLDVYEYQEPEYFLTVDRDYNKGGYRTTGELKFSYLLSHARSLLLYRASMASYGKMEYRFDEEVLTAEDVSVLSNVYELDLSGTDISDVTALRNVHWLNLSGTNVTDVSALGNVHTLDLSDTDVTDVSALGNVHVLLLSCTGVTDVSMLGNVYKLDLSNTSVEDVSALGNVHTLYLFHTPVRDVSALGNVHVLDLSWTKVKDVSALGNVHTLKLCGTNVTDVSALSRVKNLCTHHTPLFGIPIATI